MARVVRESDVTDAETEHGAGLDRRRDVADMMCTAHAWLRDRYATRARLLDGTVLLLSGWVTLLGLADQTIAAALAPAAIPPTLWAGCLGAGTFGLALIQTMLDLRSRAGAHARAFDLYWSIRNAAEAAIRNATASHPDLTELERLEASKPLVLALPDALFLRAKRRHLRKRTASAVLNRHPAALLPLLAARDVITNTAVALRNPVDDRPRNGR